MLSIFSCVCWQSVYLLWRNVYLGLLPISLRGISLSHHWEKIKLWQQQWFSSLGGGCWGLLGALKNSKARVHPRPYPSEFWQVGPWTSPTDDSNMYNQSQVCSSDYNLAVKPGGLLRVEIIILWITALEWSQYFLFLTWLH